MIAQILDVILVVAAILAAGGVLYLLAIGNTLASPVKWRLWCFGLACVFALALYGGLRLLAVGVLG